jgi:hypothetical protein
MATEQNKSTTAGPSPSSGANAADGERQRSTIEFPYGDLDDAISVARAIYNQGAVSCTRAQLAGWMNQSMSSGAFNTRLGTARIFGLIDTERGAINLTEIGRRIVDATQERAARVEAFLAVPLYRRLFEDHQGHVLPPRPKGLEHAMTKMGVAPKQTDRARQAFERSAQQAGFFATGTERLVMPAVPASSPSPSNEPMRGPNTSTKGGGRGGGGGHPSLLIEGLFQSIPEDLSNWTAEDQARWLQTAAGVFGLITSRREQITVTMESGTKTA